MSVNHHWVPVGCVSFVSIIQHSGLIKFLHPLSWELSAEKRALFPNTNLQLTSWVVQAWEPCLPKIWIKRKKNWTKSTLERNSGGGTPNPGNFGIMNKVGWVRLILTNLASLMLSETPKHWHKLIRVADKFTEPTFDLSPLVSTNNGNFAKFDMFWERSSSFAISKRNIQAE